MELGAGVGQALQGVGQVVVRCKVEGFRVKHVVDHGQESLVVLHLKQRHGPAPEVRRVEAAASGWHHHERTSSNLKDI